MSEILIIGASGRLGSRVAERLLDRGLKVRAASRQPERLAALRERGATTVFCDLREPASIDSAVEGAAVVFHAAHALAPPDRHNPTDAVDGRGVAALIDSAARHDIDHFVLSSLLHASSEHPSEFVRNKSASEVRLDRTGVPHTILRMAAFMETHVLQLLGDPILDGKRPQIIGRGTAPRNFVSVEDAATLGERVIAESPPTRGEALDVAGPDNLSDLEAVGLLAAALGRSVTPRHLPLPAAKAIRAATRFVHPPLSTVLALAIATAETGEAVDLAPRAGLIVGGTPLARVIDRWAAEVRG